MYIYVSVRNRAADPSYSASKINLKIYQKIYQNVYQEISKIYPRYPRYTQNTKPGPSPGPRGPGPARARPRAWPGPAAAWFFIYLIFADFNLSGGCFPIIF